MRQGLAALYAVAAVMAWGGMLAHAQGPTCVDCPRAIPDAPSVITTTMRGAVFCPVVIDVDVTVVISHESRSDLVVQLEHAGERVEMWSTVGGRGHVFGVTIDDEAERPLNNATCGGLEPCAGAYRPESWTFPGSVGQWGSTANRLAALYGPDDDSPWVLRIVDTASQDVGTLITAWVVLECAALPTATPTATITLTATATLTPTATATEEPSATPTTAPTATPSGTPTAPATRTPTATATRPPTQTPIVIVVTATPEPIVPRAWLPLVTRNR